MLSVFVLVNYCSIALASAGMVPRQIILDDLLVIDDSGGGGGGGGVSVPLYGKDGSAIADRQLIDQLELPAAVALLAFYDTLDLKIVEPRDGAVVCAGDGGDNYYDVRWSLTHRPLHFRADDVFMSTAPVTTGRVCAMMDRRRHLGCWDVNQAGIRLPHSAAPGRRGIITVWYEGDHRISDTVTFFESTEQACSLPADVSVHHTEEALEQQLDENPRDVRVQLELGRLRLVSWRRQRREEEEEEEETTTGEMVDALLEPIGMARFLDEHYLKETLHLQGKLPAEISDHFFDWHDVEDHVRALFELLHVNSMRQLVEVKFLSPIRVTGPGETEGLTPELDERSRLAGLGVLWAAVADGYSLVLNAVHLFHLPTLQLVHALSDRFGLMGVGNVYLTPAGGAAFPKHFDDHDVLIVQVSGAKRWRVWSDAGPVVRHARLKHLGGKYDIDSRERWGEPREYVLNEGDRLYIPAGTLHDAEAFADTPSVHLSIGLSTSDIEHLYGGSRETLLPVAAHEGQGADRGLPPAADAKRDKAVVSDGCAEADVLQAALAMAINVPSRPALRRPLAPMSQPPSEGGGYFDEDNGSEDPEPFREALSDLTAEVESFWPQAVAQVRERARATMEARLDRLATQVTPQVRVGGHRAGSGGVFSRGLLQLHELDDETELRLRPHIAISQLFKEDEPTEVVAVHVNMPELGDTPLTIRRESRPDVFAAFEHLGGLLVGGGSGDDDAGEDDDDGAVATSCAVGDLPVLGQEQRVEAARLLVAAGVAVFA